jgi:1,2-diacylglycerol 3-beta-galactosyltransferase
MRRLHRLASISGSIGRVSKPKVTILTAAAGGGHMTAAWALSGALQPHAQVTVLSLLDDHGPFPLNHFSAAYPRVVKVAPLAYRVGFESIQGPTRARMVHETMHLAAAPRLRKPLVDSKPDVVISVYHFLTGTSRQIMRRAGVNVPFVTVVTDPATIPVLWFYRDVELVCVAEEQARTSAIESGVAPDRVMVTGLPVRRAFTDPSPRTVAELRAEFGLVPDLPVVLMVAGGAGMGNLEALARKVGTALQAAGIPAQLALIAGKNASLQRKLASADWPLNTTVCGFTDRMADWMRAADVLVTKAGPGTIAEAACVGVPTLLFGHVPGQEEGNVDWAKRLFGMPHTTKASEAARTVVHWLSPAGARALADIRRLEAENAHPEAAQTIAKAVLDLVGSQPEPLPKPLGGRRFLPLHVPMPTVWVPHMPHRLADRIRRQSRGGSSGS